jgi:flagellar hook-associated protein 1 FlgK
MSLTGTLNIGKTALAVSQAAIQTTGNNIANASNPDYTRQVARLTPARDREYRAGMFLGTGVDISAVQRQIDEALESRIRASVADSESADTIQQWLTRLEAVFNELTDQDLSSQLSKFFGAWSNLANRPQDPALRQVVIQNGQSLANAFQSFSTQMTSLRDDAEGRLDAIVREASTLAGQIAELNNQVVNLEGGTGGVANGLRDRRDAALRQLSSIMDITVRPTEAGALNVFVGSEPLVIGADSRGVALRTETEADGTVSRKVVFEATGGEMRISTGKLGALGASQQTIRQTLEGIDKLASTLIFELNKLHSSGQGLEKLSTVTAANAVSDTTVPLSDPAAELKHPPVNGSFVVHVTSRFSGLTSSTLVQVDLDGLNGDDTTLDSLASAIDAIDGVAASVQGGRLKITSESTDDLFSFSQDSSGVLAALGINTFFTGSVAGDIAVRSDLSRNPSLLAAARNGEPADNQTARLIAALETTTLEAMGGVTLQASYESVVNTVATTSQAAKDQAEASRSILETLTAQREAISGVSLDEEAVQLLRQQRAFQGAARLVSVVDELMRTILAMAA